MRSNLYVKTLLTSCVQSADREYHGPGGDGGSAGDAVTDSATD